MRKMASHKHPSMVICRLLASKTGRSAVDEGMLRERRLVFFPL